MVGADRAALAGAAVVALDAAASARTLSALLATSESDGDGRFRLGPLAPGRYRVTAAAAGHLPASRTLAVGAGQTVRGADFALEAGGFVLSGRVLDAGAGAIAGGRVRAHVYGEASDTTVALARTDRAGAYRLTLPRGFHELVADADGYAPARTAVWVVGQLSRDFRLIPAASIAGRVVHRGTASPVAQARVRLEPARGLEVDTDAEGAFVFDALEPGDYHLHARAGRLAGQLASPVAARLGTRVEGVLIEVEPGRALAGRVRRGGGGPVVGATVAVVARGEPRGETTSDAGGAFRFEGLLPGPHLVRATAPGFLAAVRSASLAEQDLPGIDLELQAAAQVRGLVVDAQDRPCPATISVESDERRGKPVRAGDDGRFLLADLPPGETALRAECGPRGRARLDLGKVAPDERREVTLRLSAGGLHVRGTVRWKDGSPAAGIELTAGNLRADMSPEQTTTNPSGGYQLGPLPAGALVMVEARSPIATGSDPASGRRTVRLTGPQDATGVDFVLARSEGAIRGVVTGPGGAPLPGAVVAAEAPTFTRAVTDQDGSFVLDGLAPEDHQLRAEYPGLVSEEKEVAAGRRDVRFQLRRGALLAGVVEGGGGRGAGFCSVWARPAGGSGGGQDPNGPCAGPAAPSSCAG